MKVKRLTKEDVETFMENLSQSTSDNAKRDYAIAAVMAYAGLRVSEVIRLEKTDVDFEKGQMVVSSEKSKNQRTIAVNNKILSALDAYQETDNVKSEYLFHDGNGDMLKPDEVKRMFGKSCKGSDSVCPAMLRDFYFNHAPETMQKNF
jgi:integrase/recombinase XerD